METLYIGERGVYFRKLAAVLRKTGKIRKNNDP